MYTLSIVNAFMVLVLFHSNEATFEQKYFEIQRSKSLVNVDKQYNDLSIQECASLCMDIARAEECSAAGYNFRSRECQLSRNGIHEVVDDVKAVVITNVTFSKVTQDCGMPPAIANGSLTYNTLYAGSTATVGCNFGYNYSVATITCLDTGMWELAKCDIVGCGPIQYTNANVTYVGGTVEGATVSVSFQNGNESISAICGGDGNWVWSTFAHFENPAEVWELMFRGTAENGYDVTAAYLDGIDGITTSDPACMSVQNNSCSLHYRNPKLDNWSALGVRKVRYEMYNDGVAVMSITVDGTGTTMADWLYYGGGTWRALQWPWTDLTTSSRGWWALSDWDALEGRSFRIIQKYDYCDGDYYYTVVLYQPTYGCVYENHTLWPQFLYAKGNTGAYFESAEYGLASVMAVWVYHD